MGSDLYPENAEQGLIETSDTDKMIQKQWVQHLVFQDIVLRTCKFTDTDTRSWSFEQIFKELRKRKATEKQVAGLDKEITKYRKYAKHYEKQHRNKYMAHLSKGDPGEAMETIDLRKIIQKALSIIDKMAGKKVDYKEGEFDLRAFFEDTLSSNSPK